MKAHALSASWLLAVVVSAHASDENPVTLPLPAMVGPLTANPHPTTFDAGDLGKVYVTGAVTGLGMWQNHVFPGDHRSQADIDNAQVFIQKPDGLIQFYAQAGAYSLPALGSAYVRTSDAVDAFYGPLPQAMVKLAPTEEFSIMVGKLPTLFGAEYTFTYENMNIERGLLWNQENAVNRGVQAGYSHGPLSLALSWNDGFFSNHYSWLTGSIGYCFDSSNSVSLYGGGNLSDEDKSTLVTPLAQNNSQVYGVVYTHTDGPWTLSPYLQYTHVPKDTDIGIADDASTYGAALLAKYSFDSNFSLAGRAEYIDSTGSVNSPSLLYGPDSNAWSLTITPTYQDKAFFVRAEASYVRANDTTSGLALGPNLNDNSQTRLLVEFGILF